MMEITIELQCVSFERISRFAEHFGCKAHKTRTSYHYRITADDPMSFYWLGANIGNNILNEQDQSSLSKFIEL